MKSLISLLLLLAVSNTYAATEKACVFMQDYGIHVPRTEQVIYSGYDNYLEDDDAFIEEIVSKPLVKALVERALVAFEYNREGYDFKDMLLEGPDESGRSITVYKIGFDIDALTSVGATAEDAKRFSEMQNLYYVDFSAGDNGMGTALKLVGVSYGEILLETIATGGDNDFSICPDEYYIDYISTEEE